jgi:CheY-like chemotaxis protein
MRQNNFILLAEDDEDDQELIRMAFSKISTEYKFTIVNNGQELLDRLSNYSNLPCLIILDLNMPVLNGIQTLAALKNEAKFNNVPKVVFTTSDSDDNKKRSFINGAVDYFVKPSTLKEFIVTAEKMLTYCH